MLSVDLHLHYGDQVYSIPDAAPIRMGCDNQGALKLIDTGIFKAKTKHTIVKYRHIQDEQKNHKTVDFHYT